MALQPPGELSDPYRLGECRKTACQLRFYTHLIMIKVTRETGSQKSGCTCTGYVTNVHNGHTVLLVLLSKWRQVHYLSNILCNNNNTFQAAHIAQWRASMDTTTTLALLKSVSGGGTVNSSKMCKQCTEWSSRDAIGHPGSVSGLQSNMKRRNSYHYQHCSVPVSWLISKDAHDWA